jgi:hypothetical protein
MGINITLADGAVSAIKRRSRARTSAVGTPPLPLPLLM